MHLSFKLHASKCLNTNKTHLLNNVIMSNNLQCVHCIVCICDVCTLTFAVFLVAGVYGGQTDSQSKPYTPRRAVMYVPGNDQKKIQKVTSLDLDCAVLDCEDGVAANKKVNFFWFPLENCQDDF